MKSKFKSEKGMLEIDGFRLRYVIEGEGLPVLVVGSSVYYPRTFSENLRAHLKLIFMDHRGFAEAQNPDEIHEASMAVLLEDIERMRRHLKLEQVVILGHSGHAFLALEYAKMYPQSVSHVVLLATGPSNDESHAKSADQYFFESADSGRKKELERQLELLPQDIQSAPEKRFISFCIRLGPRSWFDFRFDATDLWSDVSVNMKWVDHMWGVLFRDVDVLAGLENLKAPVFLGLGLFDYLVAPHFTWNSLKPKFKDLTVRLFTKSSHCPQLEEPEVFDSELLSWLQKQA